MIFNYIITNGNNKQRLINRLVYGGQITAKWETLFPNINIKVHVDLELIGDIRKLVNICVNKLT